jgi:hypothetical protein
MQRVEVVDLDTYKRMATSSRNKARSDALHYSRFSYDMKSRVPKVSEVRNTPSFCICNQPENPDRLMVCCERCNAWFHGGAAHKLCVRYQRHKYLDFHVSVGPQNSSLSARPAKSCFARCYCPPLADCVGFMRKKGEFLCSVCGTKSKGRRGKRPHGLGVKGNNKRQRVAKPAQPPAKPVGPVFLAKSANSTRLRVEVRPFFSHAISLRCAAEMSNIPRLSVCFVPAKFVEIRPGAS